MTGREGCIHVSGLLSQSLAAGFDEFRGSTPESAHCARRRSGPVGLADPRSVLCSISTVCWSTVLTATKRMVGRVTASQIASASARLSLAPLHVWFDVGGRHQPRRMPQSRNLPSPVMCRATSLHPVSWFLRWHQLATDPTRWKGRPPHQLSSVRMPSFTHVQA